MSSTDIDDCIFAPLSLIQVSHSVVFCAHQPLLPGLDPKTPKIPNRLPVFFFFCCAKKLDGPAHKTSTSRRFFFFGETSGLWGETLGERDISKEKRKEENSVNRTPNVKQIF